MAVNTSFLISLTAVLITVPLYFCKSQLDIDSILAGYNRGSSYPDVTVQYPLDSAVLPPDIIPPVFRWSDKRSASNSWLVSFRFKSGHPDLNILSDSAVWVPTGEQWQIIKTASLDSYTSILILGVNRA